MQCARCRHENPPAMRFCGQCGAALLTRAMETLLFGVKPGDPITYAVAAATLVGVAMLASYLPARRAATVDPVIALRAE